MNYPLPRHEICTTLPKFAVRSTRGADRKRLWLCVNFDTLQHEPLRLIQLRMYAAGLYSPMTQMQDSLPTIKKMWADTCALKEKGVVRLNHLDGTIFS